MKQERLINALECIERLIKHTENVKNIARTNWKSAKVIVRTEASDSILNICRPIRHALNKAIEKPVRQEGNCEICPDCGTTVRKKDNYCRICGQRLKVQMKKEKALYEEIKQKKKKGKNQNGRKG